MAKLTSYNDLAAFAAIATEGNFTRAAARLGVSQSALSHAIRSLEERVGVRLLARTTRSVSVTEAGERLLRTVAPALEGIDSEVAALAAMRDRPAGSLRLTIVQHGYDTIVRPILPRFLMQHPDICIEVAVDDAFVDIVSERFDAGIRLGGMIERDMVAVRVGPDIEFAVVAAPGYFERHPEPKIPSDLHQHRCINYRMGSSGGIYPWEFERDGRPVQVRVEGPLVFNDGAPIMSAALDGCGLAYVFLDEVEGHLASGRLRRVLADWCPARTGYHLYHSSRRQSPPALAALIEALRTSRLDGSSA